MRRKMPSGRATVAAMVTAFAILVVGCGAPQSSSSTPSKPSGVASVGKLPPETGPGYRVDVTPGNFPTPTTIDNPYYPLTPGTRHVYEGTGADGPEQIVKEILRETKTIMGVKTVVMHDYVTRNGKLYEDTYDWFAQDKDGNVWYFGEATKKLDDKTGQLTSTAGAWEAGVKGAQPGIVMKAKPAVGQSFFQEYAKGEAEDQADVIKVGETVTTKAGTYSDTFRTKDYTALDTSAVENKLYARGIGFVFVEHVVGPPGKIELVHIEKF